MTLRWLSKPDQISSESVPPFSETETTQGKWENKEVNKSVNKSKGNSFYKGDKTMGFKETLGKMIGIEEADETITVEEIER